MEPVMRRAKAVSLIFVTTLCLAGGCANAPHRVSMDVDQPEMTPVMTLGAGDALGWRIYQQDVILAMRDGYSRGIYQPQIFPNMDVRMVEVPTD